MLILFLENDKRDNIEQTLLFAMLELQVILLSELGVRRADDS